LALCTVLWAIIDRNTPSPVVDAAKREGFEVDQEWALHRSMVIRLKRPRVAQWLSLQLQVLLTAKAIAA